MEILISWHLWKRNCLASTLYKNKDEVWKFAFLYDVVFSWLPLQYYINASNIILYNRKLSINNQGYHWCCLTKQIMLQDVRSYEVSISKIPLIFGTNNKNILFRNAMHLYEWTVNYFLMFWKDHFKWTRGYDTTWLLSKLFFSHA